jgi:hypothetical protein
MTKKVAYPYIFFFIFLPLDADYKSGSTKSLNPDSKSGSTKSLNPDPQPWPTQNTKKCTALLTRASFPGAAPGLRRQVPAGIQQLPHPEDQRAAHTQLLANPAGPLTRLCAQ